MAVYSIDGRSSGEVFDDAPTVRLYPDDALDEDLDYMGPAPAPGLQVVRIESEDRRRAWLRPVAVVLASVLFALVVSLVLRSKGSRRQIVNSTMPQPAVSRLLSRRVSPAGRRGFHRIASRTARGPAHHRRVAIEDAGAPRPVARPVLPVVTSRVVDVPAPPPVRVAPPHGEEFGFER
jgi:hypothetical protein